ncbi:GNAT family N-acetyltransferase [Oceanobacillus bengalensis]|uniref:N-acetyltransferase n=1 Tax=Oceanobacillus bengalensis TaxID=1435466 RepID=A0A494YWY1_9BACI|nr:GNAT family N-acetyltransferase [Oceanobacillus bengalensis]RKQ14523.1 N-acetyltransferase [Oceanobacillus bengalensis]
MIIREAEENDIAVLTKLMTDLGYPTTEERMAQRFRRISNTPGYHTIVAELDGKVVGMAGLCEQLFYEYDGSYFRLVAFVIDSKHRRQHIGKRFLQDVEKWVATQGATTIVLNSGTRAERDAAHQFYKNMGYEEKSLGYRKQLF